ncbi:hypothetical protein BOX15_Mlig002314g1, partial [Macrostomum lignano]
ANKDTGADEELDRFMQTFDFESHWKHLEETFGTSAQVKQEAGTDEAAGISKEAEKSQEVSTKASEPQLKVEPVEPAAGSPDDDSQFVRTKTRPTLQASKSFNRTKRDDTTTITKTLANNKPTKTVLLADEPSNISKLPAAVSSAPPKPSQQSACLPKSRKRKSSGTPQTAASASSQSGTSGATSAAEIPTERQAMYQRRNIKFQHPFPKKSVLTLSESQQFSRLMSMRWRYAIAIAEITETDKTTHTTATDGAASSSATINEKRTLGPNVIEADLEIYRLLSPKVRKEQALFKKYAEEAHKHFPSFTTCVLPDEDKAYFNCLQRTLSHRRSRYPDYYRTLDSVSMVPRQNGDIDCWATTSDEAVKLNIKLEQVVARRGHRMLLNPHQISQSNCPSITIGIEHLADNFPNQTADNSGYQLHWKPCPISEDDFAKKLARRHDCHLVLSCATLKRMLLDRVCEAGWEMPALMEEPHDKFDAGNGQWLLCIDNTLPHFNAAGVSAADIQAKLAQMRARLKFTKANKSQKQIKKQQQEQPAENRQKISPDAEDTDNLALLETFGTAVGDCDGNATDSSNDEDAGAETSSTATAAAVTAAANGPALIYSVLQIGRHRLLVRSRRPFILPHQTAKRLFDSVGRGFAPRPSAASGHAKYCQSATPCHLRVQLERQPYFGCETPSPLQSCRDWLACLATGGDTPLLRTRCNVFDGRVLLYEFLSPDDLAEEAAGSGLLSGGLVAFNTLANAIERLRVTVGGFPAGVRLLLRRSPGDPACRLMLSEASCREHLLSMPPNPPSASALPPPDWRPIDTVLLSHPHWRDRRVPALFDPRIVDEVDKQGIRFGSRDSSDSKPDQQRQQSEFSWSYPDRGRGAGRGSHRGRGGRRGGRRGGGRGGGEGGGPRARNPESKKSQKAARWMERNRQKFSGGGSQQRVAGAGASASSAAAAAAPKWVRASSPSAGGGGE